MCSDKMEYISKEKCNEEGFVRGRRGICKMSVLERLYSKGRLDYGDKKYSADDRLYVGERLRGNYLRANVNKMSSNLMYVKVDGGKFGGRADDVLVMQQKYLAAIKVVPREFWSVVRLVCIENKFPKFDEGLSARRKSELSYLYCCDLCRGLDRLADYYCSVKQL